MSSRRLMGFTPLAENHLRESLIRFSSESYAPQCIRAGRSMSALGQKRTSQHVRSISALPPKADIGTQSWNVRFVPKADSWTAQKWIIRKGLARPISSRAGQLNTPFFLNHALSLFQPPPAASLR